jgi:hypothetical protein
MRKVLRRDLNEDAKKGQEASNPSLATNPISFFLIIAATITINLLAQRLFDWREYFIYTEVGFSILALLMPWIAAFLYKRTCSLLRVVEQMIDLSTQEIDLWFQCQQDSIFHSFWSYPVSALFSLAGIMTLLFLGLPWSGVIGFIFLVFWGTFMLATGTVGWMYVGLLLFLYRLSNLRVKGAPFEWPEEEFENLNNAYLLMLLPGVLLYIGMVIVVWASGGEWVALYHPLGRLWIFPVAGAAVSFLLASQYFIHRLMAGSKQRRLGEIDRLLKETYESWLTERSVERAKMVTELMNWRTNVRHEQDWPLNLRSNFAIVSGLLLPTVKTIIDILPR